MTSKLNNNKSFQTNSSGLVTQSSLDTQISSFENSITTLTNTVNSISSEINPLFSGTGTLSNINCSTLIAKAGIDLVNSQSEGMTIGVDSSGNILIIGNLTVQGNLTTYNVKAINNSINLQFNNFQTFDEGNNETVNFFTFSGNTINFSNTSSTNNFYGANNFNTINSNNIQELSDSAVVELFTNTLNIGHSSLTTNINSATTNIDNLNVSSNCGIQGQLNVNAMSIGSGFSLGTTGLQHIMFIENNITSGSVAFQFPCSHSFYICLNCSDYTGNYYQKTEFNGNIHSGSPSYNTNNLGTFNSSEPTVTVPSSGQIQLSCFFVSGNTCSAFGFFVGF
jgi:hypothetical protein